MRRALILTILTTVLLATPGLALMPRLDLPTLVSKADRIVMGWVVEVASKWDLDGNLIYSTATVLVEEALKGETDPTILVKTEGGEVGHMRVWVSVAARFLPGERVIVFLKETEEDYYEVAGLMQGKYTVENEIVVEKDLSLKGFMNELMGLRTPEEESSSVPCTIKDTGCKWPLPYRPVFFGNRNGTADCTGEWKAFQKAGMTWNKVPCADFKFLKGGLNDGTAPLRDDINQVAWSWEGGNYFAKTTQWILYGEVLETDIVMDDFWPWSASDSCPPDRIDVQNIATNELGNAACLDDNYNYECREATMFGYAAYGETKKRTLTSDDEDTFCDVY